jgi:uncharacterized membrane protein YfcA
MTAIDLTADDLFLLTLAGCFVGVLNTLAGGGSLLAIPLLMWLGLPAINAAATSRPAIVLQNIVAVASFRRQGLYRGGVARRAALLGLLTIPGAILGAWFLAFHVDGELFKRLLGCVMIVVAVATWRRRRRGEGQGTQSPQWFLFLLFGLVGFYGGFIQAGVGFVIMTVLFHFTVGQSPAQVNAIKVLVTLAFCLIGAVVLFLSGRIHPLPAVCLAAGQGVGGAIGARLSIGLAERYLMGIYTILLIVFAAALLVGL